MRTRTVLRTSTFPASADAVFQKLLDLKTLQKIVFPYATFTPLDADTGSVWKARETYAFYFRLLGVLPFGIHRIHVTTLEERRYEIYTHEQNTHVPTWNHRIHLKPIDSGSCSYTDEVVIFAGWKTPFIYLWAKGFYAHRQRKWIRLLKQGMLLCQTTVNKRSPCNMNAKERDTMQEIKQTDISKKSNIDGGRFWSRWAGIYDRFMSKDQAAYAQMYERIRASVRGKDVLELATGTGLIARNIVGVARSVEATDASPEMIAEAKKKNASSKLHFSVQDIFHLPHADGSFPVIIAANVLHIIPEPEKAIAEMKRVLAPDGLLILPTFTHDDMGFWAHAKAAVMKRFAGFPLHHAWSPATYQAFLEENGLRVTSKAVFKASFPLTYIACVKRDASE